MAESPDPERERVLFAPADAFVERLTHSDARAMLEAAEGLEVSEALAGEAVPASVSRSGILDSIATMLASGELVLLKRDQRCVELDLPSTLFDDGPKTPLGS